MTRLHEGDVIEARVLGFFPERRVLLDVEGESVMAWSRLALVRGMRVRVRVRHGTHGTELCVMARLADDDHGAPPGGRTPTTS